MTPPGSHIDVRLQKDPLTGEVFIVGDVIGRIPIPEEHAARAFKEYSELQESCEAFNRALFSLGDPEEARKILEGMEARWGSSESKIRALQWQLFEETSEE